MIRRILFIAMFVCGIALLFAPLQDEVQNKSFYTVKADGTWQEPSNPNVCNTHAANQTGTLQNHECVAYFIIAPIGFMFAGLFFGVMDHRLPGEEREFKGKHD